MADRVGVDELVKEFLAESEDGLDRVERCLMQMQRQPGSTRLLSEIFRALHTLKGGTGFLGFRRLEGLAHAGEELLDAVCKQRLTMTPARVIGLLRLTDALRGVLLLIERSGGEGYRESDHAGDRALVKLLLALGKRADGEGARALAGAERDTGKQADAGSCFDPLRSLPDGGMEMEQAAVRVEVQLLTRMTELVGELEEAQEKLLGGRSDPAEPRHLEQMRRLQRATRELRETVEQARTQPAGVLFRRFPRIVRDVAASCGRRVHLEMAGDETALDKSVLHALKDPLTHALRNAIDHGIETPLERTRVGKPIEGRVRVEARVVGDAVEIEVTDDGAGISRSAVLERAIALGLVEERSAPAMTDREVLWLVFEPGFSTAKEVTHISGRGVGMDVVRANVEGVGGTVEMQSTEGVGTRLCLRVPRSISMVSALLMRSGGEIVAVPQRSVIEVVPCVAENGGSMIGGERSVVFRGEQLDVLRLGERRGAGQTGAKTADAMVIVEAQGTRYGVECEEIPGWKELAVTGTGNVHGRTQGVCGESVLADGARVLVLEVQRMDVAGKRPRRADQAMVEEDEGAVAGAGVGAREELVSGRAEFAEEGRCEC